MQDQVEARAGLNGAGAGYGQMPLLDAETMPVAGAAMARTVADAGDHWSD